MDMHHDDACTIVWRIINRSETCEEDVEFDSSKKVELVKGIKSSLYAKENATRTP